jgi:hypothetical protein
VNIECGSSVRFLGRVAMYLYGVPSRASITDTAPIILPYEVRCFHTSRVVISPGVLDRYSSHMRASTLTPNLS